MRRREFQGAGPAGAQGTRRRGHRRRRGLAAGLCLLGAVCGLAATGCGSAPSSSTAGQPPGVPAGAPAVGGQLLQRIDAAQDPAGYLVETTATQGSGTYGVTVVWTDLANGNAMLQRGSGAAKVANWERDYYDNRVLHWDQTQVNYGPRTWWTADEHEDAPVKGPVPTGPAGGGYTPAALVTAVLDKTAGKIVGHPVLDGRRTIELSASMAGSQFEFWVDSRTYQVIRTVKYFTGMLHIPPIVSDYDWVRATAAMFSLINHPQVPAGFTRVRIGQYYPAK